jgi:hypothetical protein
MVTNRFDARHETSILLELVTSAIPEGRVLLEIQHCCAIFYLEVWINGGMALVAVGLNYDQMMSQGQRKSAAWVEHKLRSQAAERDADIVRSPGLTG